MIFFIYFDFYYATASTLMQLCLNKNDYFFGFGLFVEHLHLKSVHTCVTLRLLAALKAVIMGIHADGDIVLCDSMLLQEQQATHMPCVDVAPSSASRVYESMSSSLYNYCHKFTMLCCVNFRNTASNVNKK